MALWDMLPDQPLTPTPEETAWGILIEKSILEELENDAWAHLNAQAGGGTGIILHDGLEVEIDMAFYELEIETLPYELEIEIELPAFELEIETMEFELLTCDLSTVDYEYIIWRGTNGDPILDTNGDPIMVRVRV